MTDQATAQSDLAALLKEDRWFEDFEDLTIVQEGDWTQDHKYQTCETVVDFKGHLFEIQQSRSGSYHTDWFYSDTQVVPVERHEETKVIVTYKATGKGVSVPGEY